jgi:hypothetical protein
MIDLTKLLPAELLKVYEIALAEKLILTARLRQMYSTNAAPELLAASEVELTNQAAWVATIENALRKRGLLK